MNAIIEEINEIGHHNELCDQWREELRDNYCEWLHALPCNRVSPTISTQLLVTISNPYCYRRHLINKQSRKQKRLRAYLDFIIFLKSLMASGAFLKGIK